MLTGWARYNVQRGGAREAGGVQANRQRESSTGEQTSPFSSQGRPCFNPFRCKKNIWASQKVSAQQRYINSLSKLMFPIQVTTCQERNIKEREQKCL